jgi:hypothetical protein
LRIRDRSHPSGLGAVVPSTYRKDADVVRSCRNPTWDPTRDDMAIMKTPVKPDQRQLEIFGIVSKSPLWPLQTMMNATGRHSAKNIRQSLELSTAGRPEARAAEPLQPLIPSIFATSLMLTRRLHHPSREHSWLQTYAS